MAEPLRLPQGVAPELAQWIGAVVRASGFAGRRAADLAAELLDHVECAHDAPGVSGDPAGRNQIVRRMGDPERLGRRLARQRLWFEFRQGMQLPAWIRSLLGLDLAVLGVWFVFWLPPDFDLRQRFGLVVPVLVGATLASWGLLGLGTFGVRLLRGAGGPTAPALIGAGALLTAIGAWFIVCMSAVANAVAELLARWPVRHQVELLLLMAGVLLAAIGLGLLLLPVPARRTRLAAAT